MLRIKKDYDLEKLKEYGFVNTIRNIYYLDCETEHYNFVINILVNSLNNYDNNEILIYYSNDGYEATEVDDIAEIPEVIYNLIKNGIVEIA